MAKIFIGNIPFSLNKQDFEKAIKDLGVNFASAELIQKENNSLGFGFLTVEKEEEVQNVINAINGKTIGGRKVRAEKAVAEKAVFVGGLPSECQEKDIAEIFNDTKFTRVTIIMDKVKTNVCKGFAFVYFENLEAAKKAIETVSGTTINGATIKVELARRRRNRRFRRNSRRNNKKPRSRRFRRGGSRKPKIPLEQREKSPNTVYVGHINKSATEEEVKALFAEFKPVSVNYTKRGYAFVEFESAEVANKVIAKFNDTEFKNNKIVCNIACKKIEPETPAKKE